MDSDKLNSKYRYQIGPSDEMKMELGQIVANHGICDSAIYDLFIALLGAPAQNTRILVKSQKIKALSMATTIKALIESDCLQIDDELKNRILSAIEMFRVFSRERNKLVHWQWEATSEPFAKLSNSLGAIDPQFPQSASISLPNLRETALALAGIATELMMIAALIESGTPIEISKAALAHHDAILKRVKEALLILPPVSDEDLS